MSVYDFEGKVAIVTGAGSGIGHKVAELLLQAGCNVVFADLKLQPGAESTLQNHPLSSNERPVGAIFHKTDVTDWSQLNSLFEATLKVFGQVDIIANIAGVYDPPFSDFWKPPGVSPESRDAPDASPGSYCTISVNYIAPVRLAQLAIDYWCRNPQVKGNFLAVSSIAAFLHSLDTPLYMSSKAALVSFVKSLGELNDIFGIRVSAVCPGGVNTPLLAGMVGDENLDEGSLTPQECAGVIIRVLSEPQWGRGSIVETLKKPEKSQYVVSVRDVDLEGFYPKMVATENILKKLGESHDTFIARLKDKGMRP
ncbi:unnamed protein product [Penicillium salamii]|nr:unnamed protein product [Penicillium salamii]CAG8236737.1 unnamed protein product [Penicillium salamii]